MYSFKLKKYEEKNAFMTAVCLSKQQYMHIVLYCATHCRCHLLRGLFILLMVSRVHHWISLPHETQKFSLQVDHKSEDDCAQNSGWQCVTEIHSLLGHLQKTSKNRII